MGEFQENENSTEKSGIQDEIVKAHRKTRPFGRIGVFGVECSGR